MDFSHIAWVCTDTDTQQYGRQISEQHFQFKEGEMEPFNIFLDNYNNDLIEDIINSYGYTLLESKPYGVKNIQEICGEKWEWIIAECIFETEYAAFRE